MNPDVAIVIVGVLALIGLGLGWIWGELARHIRELHKVERELMSLFEERRDILPYLIESYRVNNPKPDNLIQKLIQELIQERDEARRASNFHAIQTREEQLEKSLSGFLKQGRANPSLELNIGWLEARKDIEGYREKINAMQEQHQVTQGLFVQKSKQFPYAIFKGKFLK